MGVTFITGGARSGKSALAVRLASSWPGPVTLIATAEPRDEEMREKIAAHRADRPAAWTTVEEPVEIVPAVESAPDDHLVVVDCLTLWVANALERGVTAEEIAARASSLAKAAVARVSPVLVVTNEVGDGIVPMDPETREYRNLMGIVNAIVASEAERAWLVVAGRVVPLDDPGEEGLR
jgi:adenosylcobinamide kinase / adenosylcobinamide-phosphate guanylyltransferase